MTLIKNLNAITLEAKSTTINEGTFAGKTKTELFQNGKMIAVIPPQAKQPRINQKKISLKGWDFKLKWDTNNHS
jgi:hypothetical protein